MQKQVILVILVMVFSMLACASEDTDRDNTTSEQTSMSRTQLSSYEVGSPGYGFFTSPPEATIESVLQHYADMSEHADFVLVQQSVPWRDFRDGIERESQVRTDLRNQIKLAEQNGLDWIFVVDPLNGLNRREFMDLPFLWEPSFGNPDVQSAFINFTLWILREFKPRYLGLASEINTYLDAHPDDAENYMKLYREVHDLIKAESPDTQVFVTFQWDDLNNMFVQAAEGRPAYQTNWEQVEAFEPRLDLWVISTYPYFVFPEEPIPGDYYTALLERTDKPIAVAEGGWASRPVAHVPGDPDRQVDYLEAIHEQLGDRLAFWVYLILNDINMESYQDLMLGEGRGSDEVDTLGYFATVGLREFDGTPKPALEVWDSYRNGR